MIHPKIDFIIMNNTAEPRTGGDYVYAVMKNELIRQGYTVSEVSIPLILDCMKLRDLTNRRPTSLPSMEILAYLWCYASSLKKFMLTPHMIITSSCPAFPVFGHLTYHQPKAGILTGVRKESDSIERKIGYRIEENEALSPMWILIKRLIRLHLSNSDFTKRLVKRIYDIDSKVLYPPVPVHKYLSIDTCSSRKPYILITRPEAPAGISSLSEIARYLPKNVKFIIMGKIDQAGIKTLHDLKDMGAEFDYLGYVREERKVDIFRECSAYINLAPNETFGISVVEAMAGGCVPIAHDSGSIPEFLPEQFRYSDPKEASEKIGAYIDSRKVLRDELRGIALRFDEANFRKGFTVFIERLETWLETR